MHCRVSKAQSTIEFIVDTGFNGELCLPSQVLRELNAVYRGKRIVELADGFEGEANYYRIDLDWNDEERPTEVIATQGNPLLGNVLLEGCFVQIDMTNGGEVTIEFP